MTYRVKAAGTEHIEAICDIAERSWRQTYIPIVGEAQVAYMLKLFYNKDLLKEQLKDPAHDLRILFHEHDIWGYAHCVLEPGEHERIKLSKIYMDPEMKTKGGGKFLLTAIENSYRENGFRSIYLNVNRNNPAFEFYKKMGYHILKEVDIPLDRFWLNDYVMEKSLR